MGISSLIHVLRPNTKLGTTMDCPSHFLSFSFIIFLRDQIDALQVKERKMQIGKRLSFRSKSDNGLKLLKSGKRAPFHLRGSSTRANDEAEPLAWELSLVSAM